MAFENRDPGKYDAEYRANRKRLIALNGLRCQKCGSTDRVQCDHIAPHGGNKITNLQLLCVSCHGAKTFAENPAWSRGKPQSPTFADPAAKPTTQW